MVTFILWGSLYVVSQYVLGEIPTFLTALLRYLFFISCLVRCLTRQAKGSR